MATKTDNGQWGELFEISIKGENGRTFTVRIEEHEFEHFKRVFTDLNKEAFEWPYPMQVMERVG